MTETLAQIALPPQFPDHTELPESDGTFVKNFQAPNEPGHYPITPMLLELGLWQGTYQNQPEQLWLRQWDKDGNLLLIGFEEAERERQEKEQALQQLERERHEKEQALQQVEQRQQRQQLTDKLLRYSPDQVNSLGITPADLE